jgi:DNA-binding XRE family transcriptional regulator
MSRSVIPVPPVFRKNRLAFYRQVSGIPQAELARHVGVSTVTIGHWERDERLPYKWHAQKVAEVLQIPVRKIWPHEPF